MNSSLPVKNELGFFEIRMESIGGLGANLAGKMLAEAGILKQGLNGSMFSSYGSEKKGSMIKTYIRLCDPGVEVRINSPIEEPHLLVVFHENLLSIPSITEGVGPDSIIVVNSTKKPSELRDICKLHEGTISVVDAMGIAIAEKVKLNTAMMGAIARASGFLKLEHLKEVIKKTLGKKYASLVEPNIRACDRGYSELSIVKFDANADYPARKYTRVAPKLGYENAPIGGIIETPGNSCLKDMSSVRAGFMPVLDSEKCTNCGQCDMQCPDFCLIWKEGVDKKGKKTQQLVGIDYQYCKGCMKCVEVCPTNALSSVKETDQMRKETMEVK